MHPFDGPRLKVRWARRHVESAHKATEEFLRASPYRLVIEADPDPAFQHVVLRAAEPIPTDIALIIGDAIHNLRSALDHMACDLVRLNGLSEKGVYFPIANSAAKLEERIKDTKMRRASKDAIDLIRALQPYLGGNDAIAGLHAIDIVDKHRLLVPVGQVIASRAPSPTFIRGGATITFLPDHDEKLRVLKSGEVLWKIDAIKQLAAGDEMRASFDVAFGTGTFFAGEPVVPLLHQLTDYLDRILEAFASLCLRGIHVSLPPPFLPRQKVADILRIS